jgi:hypothetical protein
VSVSRSEVFRFLSDITFAFPSHVKIKFRDIYISVSNNANSEAKRV